MKPKAAATFHWSQIVVNIVDFVSKKPRTTCLRRVAAAFVKKTLLVVIIIVLSTAGLQLSVKTPCPIAVRPIVAKVL